MKNTIRNSTTLGEVLEIAVRVNRQHGRNQGRNWGPNNTLANYVTSCAQLRDRAAEADAVQVVQVVQGRADAAIFDKEMSSKMFTIDHHMDMVDCVMKFI